MKRTVLAFVMMLLFVAVAGTQLVNSARADPFMPSGSWSDDPIPPSIDVQSPSENLTYWSERDVWLNFTVTKPSTSWYSTRMNPYPERYATTHGNLTQVNFSLDRKPEMTPDKISEDRGVLSFSVKIGTLPAGRHTITIHAEGFARYGNLTHDIYVNSQYSFNDSTKTKFVETSTDIRFVVTNTDPAAEVIIEQPNDEDELVTSTTEPFPTSSVATSTMMAIVIGACVLVYFKKRRRRRL